MAERQTGLERFIAECGEGPVLRALLSAGGDSILVTDAQRRIVYWGAGVSALAGYAAAEVLGRDVSEFLAPDAAIPQPHAEETVAIHTGQTLALRRRDGRPAPMPCTVLVAPGTPGAPADMLYLLQPAAAAAGPLPMGDPEQVSLLATVNHRMRNNLATICALLEMEVLHAPENERDRLAVCLSRIRSLSLAHDLFIEDDAHQVDMGALVRAITESAVATFAQAGSRIAVQCAPVRGLCSRRTTYLALALTELTTYLARCSHGIAVDDIGSVTLAEEAGDLTVTVHAHASAPVTPLNPLSRHILTGLVERSLRGTITIATDAPFTATLRCPIETPTSTAAVSHS